MALARDNRADCASLTPHQIVPKLADEGIYLPCESTFYRVHKAAGQKALLLLVHGQGHLQQEADGQRGA